MSEEVPAAAEQHLDIPPLSGPPLPPRDYTPRNTVPVLYVPYSPLTSPVLSRFFRLLVRAILVSSTLSVAAVMLFKTWIRPRIKAMQQAWLLVARKDLQLYTSLQQSIKTAAQSAREAKDHLQPHSEESNEADVITETPGDEITASLRRLDGSVRVLEEAPASQSALSELQSSVDGFSRHLAAASDYTQQPPNQTVSGTPSADTPTAVVNEIRALKGLLLNRRSFNS